MKTVIYGQAGLALIHFFLAEKLQAAKYRSVSHLSMPVILPASEFSLLLGCIRYVAPYTSNNFWTIVGRSYECSILLSHDDIMIQPLIYLFLT